VSDAQDLAAHFALRPDGAEIHWEARGEGPVVLIAHHSLWSYPAIYEEFVADLSRDHRVVLYDPRGCGSSSRRGPYEPLTDAADLTAVAEAAGGAAVAIAVAEGFNRAARVAAARPDLIYHVIAIGPAAAAFLPHAVLEGSEVLAASDSVIEMLLQMMKTDPRSALRTLVAAINPDLDEEALRERLDRITSYLEPGSVEERVRAWLRDDVSEQAQALGDRLWIVHGGSDPLFEGTLRARVAELYPKAHLRELADGPISRPDLTSALVRELTEAPTATR
jgi:pimeloyl-ACP methyl ester carboxylesterase